MSRVTVGIIIKDDPLSYLLVRSKKNFGKFSNYYYPPAGHSKDDESEVDTLKREIKEELGVELVSAKKITAVESDVKNQKTVWYICKISSFDFNINHEELDDVGFFTQEEMSGMKIWPATKKVFEKHLFNKGKESIIYQ